MAAAAKSARKRGQSCPMMPPPQSPRARRQCLRREAFWRSSSAELLLVAGVALLLVQMAPLSQAMLTRLSPQAARILPLWNAEGDPSTGLGTWSCISLTPGATRSALSLFLAYGLLF